MFPMLRRCCIRGDRLTLLRKVGWLGLGFGLCGIAGLAHVFLDYVIAAGVSMLLAEFFENLQCGCPHALWQRRIFPDDLVDYFNPRSQCRTDVVARLLGLRGRQLLRKFPNRFNGKSDMQRGWSLWSRSPDEPPPKVETSSDDSPHLAPPLSHSRHTILDEQVSTLK